MAETFFLYASGSCMRVEGLEAGGSPAVISEPVGVDIWKFGVIISNEESLGVSDIAYPFFKILFLAEQVEKFFR